MRARVGVRERRVVQIPIRSGTHGERLSEFLRTPNSYWIAIPLHSCRLETRWRVFVIGK